MRTKTPEKGSATLPLAQPGKHRARRQRGLGRGKRLANTAWDEIAKLAGCVEGPADWAEEHDHYIHGTPKRRVEETQ
jgi:hypothetical protein